MEQRRRITRSKPTVLSIIVCVKGEAQAPADDGFGAGLPPTGAQTNHAFNEIKLGGAFIHSSKAKEVIKPLISIKVLNPMSANILDKACRQSHN